MLACMNQINRLEETWTPKWDLGLQDEFGFIDETANEKRVGASKRGWSWATSEVLNRQNTIDRRIGSGASSIGALIAYFETTFEAENASDA